jgi:hypothetical protein
MNYNQFLGNGKRILNIRYLGIDSVYNNHSCKVVILENGVILTLSQYRRILPNFYVDDLCRLPLMFEGAIITMLINLKQLGFVSLKKECKFFDTLLKNNGFDFLTGKKNEL